MKSPYTYKYFGPKMLLHNQKNPAIFLLHGLGSDENDLLPIVQDVMDQYHVFSLRGPITNDPGFAFYLFEEEGKPVRKIFDVMLSYTQQFILEAIKEYNIDPEQVYVIGFNQGAVVAQSLFVVMGKQLRGVASLSGYLPEFVMNDYEVKDLYESKIFISHGEYDFDYPIQWSNQSRDFFQQLGTNVTYKTYPVGHGVSKENINDLIFFLSEDASSVN